MVFSDRTTDAFGHLKLGGIGDLVSAELKDRSAKYNKGKPIQTINQRLGYMVRGGDPDAIDSIVPMAYGILPSISSCTATTAASSSSRMGAMTTCRLKR